MRTFSYFLVFLMYFLVCLSHFIVFCISGPPEGLKYRVVLVFSCMFSYFNRIFIVFSRIWLRRAVFWPRRGYFWLHRGWIWPHRSHDREIGGTTEQRDERSWHTSQAAPRREAGIHPEQRRGGRERVLAYNPIITEKRDSLLPPTWGS